MATNTNPYGRNVLNALEDNVVTLTYLLRSLPINSLKWDEHPVEGRFSLREIVAHLLDFDMVCRERFERMISEDSPELPNWDEGEAAHHYTNRHPGHDLEHLLESRRSLKAWLEGLSEKEMKLTGIRLDGPYTVKEGVALMLGHDAYHLRQVTEWLSYS